jgi:hypothetical protein
MPKPAPDPAARWLDGLATQASGEIGYPIKRSVPRDRIYAWKAASVHPLQLLETEYQKIVRYAARDVPDLDERRALENRAMRRFFHFDSGELRLLGVPIGGAYDGESSPLLADGLRDSHEWLKAARKAMEPVQGAVHGRVLRKRLAAARLSAAAIFDRLARLAPNGPEDVPQLVVAGLLLGEAKALLESAETLAGFKLAWRAIGKALEEIGRLLTGVASVNLSYAIRDFYLFRLLVRYQVDSDRTLSPATIAQASAELTGLLAAPDWMFGWVAERIVDLAGRIRKADPKKRTLFFLKGGRALAYLRGDPGQGRNDWDTQIVIDPNLPAAEWYELFLEISNAVLIALQEYKVQFYLELKARNTPLVDAGAIIAAEEEALELLLPATSEETGPGDIEEDRDQDPPDGNTSANCKAEIIDVGLPRYDSVEAREQWQRLQGHILGGEGVPYPDYSYYVEEYILLLREVFAGTSSSPGKLPSRLVRMRELLDEAPAPDPPSDLRRSVAALEHYSDLGRKLWGTLLLQFEEAYRLADEPGLAAVFDSWLAEKMYPIPEPYFPKVVREALRLLPPDDERRTIATIIACAHEVSQTMESHFQLRQIWLAARNRELDEFLRNLFAQQIFSPRIELELQLALNGSFAARLQAEHARRDYDAAVLDPVAFVSVGLYSPLVDANPATMIEIVEPWVKACLRDMPNLFKPLPEVAGRTALRLEWKDEIPFGESNYTPLGIDISCHPDRRPVLSWIIGLPAISARDLLREFREQTAATQEFGRRSRLRETADAVAEIVVGETDRGPSPRGLPSPVIGLQGSQGDKSAIALTLPGQPAVIRPRHEPIGHLMISSDDNAIGRGAAYPASYEPDSAFMVSLTPNREALRDDLTWPAGAILDLLVINQGHGGIGSFAHWSAGELDAYLVRPLLESGVRANIIVLDFCVSASLLPTFAPLCAPGGILVSSLYSISAVIVTTDFWSDIRKDLAAGNSDRIRQKLFDRASRIARAYTGEANIDVVRAWSEGKTAKYLSTHHGDFDPISIIRYLPKIANILKERLDLAERGRQLRIVQTLSNLGPYERAVLDPMPPWPTRFTAEMLAAVEAAFSARLTAILVQPQYGLRLDTAGKDVFGEDGLWSMYIDHRAQIMALARGLPVCPTCFAIWNEETGALQVDSELGQDPIGKVAARQLRRVEEEAPRDAVAIIGQLRGTATVPIIDMHRKYLQ